MSLNIDHTLDKIETTSGGIIIPGPTVPANSPGNVSRWVMDTATLTASGYWAKIATFTNTRGDTNTLGKRFIAQYAEGVSGGGAKKYSSTIFSLDMRDDASSGLLAGSSGVFMETTGSISYNGVMLVGSASLGQAIDLWVQVTPVSASRKLSIIDLPGAAIDGSESGWDIQYYPNAAWQSATPTGAVTVTSDWAGSGQLTSTSFTNSTGTAYYEKSADGFVTAFLDLSTLTTTADGTTWWTFPSGYRHGEAVPIEAKLNARGVTAGDAGDLIIGSDGTVKIYNYVAGGSAWQSTQIVFRARN